MPFKVLIEESSGILQTLRSKSQRIPHLRNEDQDEKGFLTESYEKPANQAI